MARLHEYQGKALLREAGLPVPRGAVVSSPDGAAEKAAALLADGAPGVVLKIQAWTTGRKAMGGVTFATSPSEARQQAEQLLGMKVGHFPVTEVLIEEQLDIRDELFVSLSIDDARRQPLMLLALEGGSGIEQRAAQVKRLPINVNEGPDQALVQRFLAESTVDPKLHTRVLNAVVTIWNTAKRIEARSIEINPLITTGDGRLIAADCRMAVDDYAVFRHPELGIDIARELDHPPTELERIAYAVEQNDHRGTFYFAQLPVEAGKPVIGFHGAGGGGSMMSMDAVTKAGFAIANFTDTSGNPSSAKVYRAARIILSQPGLVGYFGSGSGVASQEQFHSAYGLAKAFLEMKMSIPAVIRLGGNGEDRACEILHDACAHLPAVIEGYRKDDTPAFCASRFTTLVEQSSGTSDEMSRSVPAFVGSPSAYSFPINGGQVWIDHATCDAAATSCVLRNGSMLLKADDSGKPVLAVSEDDIANKDSELIACEIECVRAGMPVLFVDLPVTGIDC